MYFFHNRTLLYTSVVPDFVTLSIVLQPEAVVNARNVYGGTASGQVAEAIGRSEKVLEITEQWITNRG